MNSAILKKQNSSSTVGEEACLVDKKKGSPASSIDIFSVNILIG